jgi:Erv1 / Alr family/Mimivirus sulfhydryl oxidase R596-like, C-terminal domain
MQIFYDIENFFIEYIIMESEGLYTQVWGPAFWQTLHNITFNYPYNPTEDDKDKYYNFFTSIAHVLPCSSCRKNYSNHIKEGSTKLTHEAFESRDSLTKWLYNLHKKVSTVLGFNDGITYEMMCKKHNSYIAKGDFNEQQKQDAFRNMYDTPAPIIKEDRLLAFADYAKERGLNDYVENVIKYSNMDHESKEWYERNQKCQDIIKDMRVNGIFTCEKDGQYEGMPTLEELKLMQLGSSNMSKKHLKKIMGKKLGCKFIKKEHK